MKGIIPDVNIEGQVLALIGHIRRSELADLWDILHLEEQTFAAQGWSHETPDREIWNRCQEAELVLITDNRNRDDEDSLEATLRDSVRIESLPVITISNKQRLQRDPGYAEQVAMDLLEVMFDVRNWNRYRGIGRLYLPLPRSHDDLPGR